MAQVSSSNTNSLPGIVTDQPEIFESEPVQSDDAGINEFDLLANDPTDDAIALIEVPIKQAFSYFAERENEIAKFYVQRHGEYKIAGDKPGQETDVEKYHRLVSEVNELLNKFQTQNAPDLEKAQMSAVGCLNVSALTSNLNTLSKQLKALEFAAEDGSLEPTQSGFRDIQMKLDGMGEKIDIDALKQTEIKESRRDVISQVRMSALERRLNLLESLLGHDDNQVQNVLKKTKSENLTEAAETLSTWLSLIKPDSAQRVGRELDYLTQRLEKINETSTSEEDKLDPQSRTKLDQLFNLVTSTDKYRAMVPTIIHRLSAMEELQQKAAHVTTTVNHLELVQSQIVDSLQSNKDELSSLNEMFSKNIEMIKEYSNDIDSRIRALRERDRN